MEEQKFIYRNLETGEKEELNFANVKVTVHDAEGEELNPTCKCGQPAATCIMGREALQWICSKCAFGVE
jgi:hypothetical protein